MDRIELLNKLDAFGQHLLGTRTATSDDVATGVAMGLLALAELLKAGPHEVEQVGSAPDASTAFKAKANRW